MGGPSGVSNANKTFERKRVARDGISNEYPRSQIGTHGLCILKKECMGYYEGSRVCQCGWRWVGGCFRKLTDSGFVSYTRTCGICSRGMNIFELYEMPNELIQWVHVRLNLTNSVNKNQNYSRLIKPRFKILICVGVSILDWNNTVSVPYRAISIQFWYFFIYF